MRGNRFARHQPTALDRKNRMLAMLLSPAWEARIMAPDADTDALAVELARVTGCNLRECECELLARRGRVERLRAGKVAW